MPFAITQMPDEPILIVKIEVPLEQHLASITSVNTQLAQLMNASSSQIYVLVDLRDQMLSFSDILIGIDLLKHPDSWIEQRAARPILVGSDPMIGIAVRRFKQQIKINLGHFETLDEALAYARAEIARSDRPGDG